MDQRTALDEIMRVARATGLTHVIIAGAGVDHWPGFGPTMDTYHGFKVVRPSGHAMETRAPRTARRLDQTLRRYCQGGEPSVLVLDSHVEDAVELTGIDAGVTDLIVQIGTEASGSAYTQLAGRAMRFGRKPTNPVRVILQ